MLQLSLNELEGSLPGGPWSGLPASLEILGLDRNLLYGPLPTDWELPASLQVGQV